MKIAVITPLLPESTGIAEFSERLYKGVSWIDLFWKKTNYSYDLKDIFECAVSRRYDAIIFTLGNSNHNFRTVEILQRFKGFPGVKTKLLIHLHDPVLTNVARHQCELVGKSFLDSCAKRDGLPHGQPSDIYQAFERYGYTGLWEIIAGCNISSIITNSKASLLLTKNDLREKYEAISSKLVLFHPCFDKQIQKEFDDRKYDVGIFGVMDNGGKLSNYAVDVILNLKRNGLINRAVLCGYNAYEYCKETGVNRYDFIDSINHPTHEQMHQIMANTKIAIQPRLLNTGESSGIVPMLITTSTRAIVSNVGAFAEYPEDLVVKIDNVNFVEDTVNLISNGLNFSINQDILNEYVLSHSPKRFLSQLLCHVEDLSKKNKYGVFL